jgi:hypothetical protein
MTNILEFQDIVYKPALLTIVEYIARYNCYLAKPFYGCKLPCDRYYLQQIGGTANFNREPDKQVPSISKHLQNSAQITQIYSPQTAVMALIPEITSHNPERGGMGFIIGEIATPAFYNTILADNSDNPDPDIDSIYDRVNKLNQTVTNCNIKSNIPINALPGDTYIVSDNAHIVMDNLSLSVGTKTANTYYSSVTGEMIHNNMLQQDRSIWSRDNTYIIKDGILNIKQFADNPYDAGLDMSDSELSKYTYTEAFGALLKGYYKTISVPFARNEENATQHLWQEYIKGNGVYRLNSATGLHFNKTSLFDELQCSGDTFKPNIDDTVKYVPYAANTKKQYIQATTSEARAQDYTKKTVQYRKDGETVDITEGEASLDFNDDGSVKITDAWGSYILLQGGNIQIHAANNIFTIADRDSICITGGVESHRASQDIQMESAEADVKIYAHGILQLGSEKTNVISKDIISVADNISLVSTTLQCVAEKDKPGKIILGGVLNATSMLSNTDIHINGKAVTTTATKSIINATPSNTNILTDKGYVVTSKMRVGGTVTVGKTSATVTVNGAQYTSVNSPGGDIKVQKGALYTDKGVETSGQVRAANVVAQAVGAVSSSEGRLNTVRNLNLESVAVKLESDSSLATNNNTVTVQIPFNVEDNYTEFMFDKESIACAYYADDNLIPNGTPCKTISKNTKGKDLYIYPGQAFWTQQGLVITTIADGKPTTKVQGFHEYLFNKNNVTRKA